jgi:hypothetical protein
MHLNIGLDHAFVPTAMIEDFLNFGKRYYCNSIILLRSLWTPAMTLTGLLGLGTMKANIPHDSVSYYFSIIPSFS